MGNGIYKFVDTHDCSNYGEILLQVNDTEKTLSLELLKNDMRFSPAHIDMLFANANKVKINKGRSPHAIEYGDDWFVAYFYRAGIPFLFERVGWKI